MTSNALKSYLDQVKAAILEVNKEISTTQLLPALEKCFIYELQQKNLNCLKLADPPFFYKGVKIENARFDSVYILENILMIQFADAYSDETMIEVKKSAVEMDLINCGISDGVIIDFFTMEEDKLLHLVNITQGVLN